MTKPNPKLYTVYKDDLYVNWIFTTPARIREEAKKHKDRLDVGNKTVHALWYKVAGMHICMTTHPPEEPKPKYGIKWWAWNKERVVWYYWFYHEYSHAYRDSAEHPEA
jgi:hypothetical protein